MKALSAFLLLSLTFESLAQTNSSPVDAPRHSTAVADQQRRRRISVANDNPLRIYIGRLYDLTDTIIAYDFQRFRFSSIQRGCVYTVEGEVGSISKEGFTVRSKDSNLGELVFVRGFPQQTSLVDRQFFRCWAFSAGRYQYTTVLGATKTVPLFEYGKRLAGSGMKFDTIVKVTADGQRQILIPFEP